MAKYVLVEEITDVILKTVDGNKEFRTGKPPILKGKPFRWLEYVHVTSSKKVNQITESPTVNITKTQYIKTWKVRDKTEQELDVEKDIKARDTLVECKALMTALNDGSFALGKNLTDAQLKTIIKEHL
tara:strand:+ start:724 stop:1107 length:384 start_codon:yes stop_codon:yes gene_type:complete